MSDPDYMTPFGFSCKVEWEGGALGALSYGLRHTDLDPDDPASAELRAVWAELEAAYAAMQPLLDRVQAALVAGDDE